MSVSRRASIPTAAASTVASIVMRGRPTSILGFSAGLDFESRIMVKEDAPELLAEELSSPKWKPQTLVMSGVTDPYQPIERKLRITRRCLEVLAKFRNPVGDNHQEPSRHARHRSSWANWPRTTRPRSIFPSPRSIRNCSACSSRAPPRPRARLEAIAAAARRRHSGRRDGRAGHSRADRSRSAGDPGSLRVRRARSLPVTLSFGCPGRWRRFSSTGWRSISPNGKRRCWAASATSAAGNG